jgi:hypothetical protein
MKPTRGKAKIKVEPIEESTLERAAKILGSFSAAQLALDDAKERRARGQEVAFYLRGETILVGPPIK